MGYACPVCEEPQVDAEHLANHLAFTAILRGGDHEAWLDEQVPDWSEQSPADLGPAVAQHAEEVEMDVSETDLPDSDAGTAGDRGDGLDGRTNAGMGAGAGERTGAGAVEGKGSGIGSGARRRTDRLSADDRAVLEEARELTRKMLEADAAEAESAEAESESDEAEAESGTEAESVTTDESATDRDPEAESATDRDPEAESASEGDAEAESFTESDPRAESASEGGGAADEAVSTAASEESEKE